MKSFLFFFVTIVLFLTILPYLLNAYAGVFTKKKLYKNADAIIILSGNPITRVPRAIELFKDGISKNIFMTQTPNNAHVIQKNSVSIIMKTENVDFFVLPSLKHGATSTFDEARDVAMYAKKNGWKKIIIVTDEFHSSRAYYAFNKVFKLLKNKTEVGIATAKNDVFSTENWWLSDSGISAYILEALKFSVYLFKSSNLEYVEQE